MSPARTREPNRLAQPGQNPAAVLAAGALALLAIFAGLLAWVSATLGGVGHGSLPGWIAGQGGTPRWSGAATAWAAGFGVVLTAACAGIGVLWWRWYRTRSWVDKRARSMSSARDLAELTEQAVTGKAAELASAWVGGVPIGKAIINGRMLFCDLESTQLWFMGPRSGKTTNICIPQVVGAPGPVVATSNKRDLVDHTRGPRSEIGAVWINDPQQLALAQPTWWWSPLMFILAGQDRVSRAWRLAATFQASAVDPESRVDAYFGPGGETLLRDLLLTAAVGGHPLTMVSQWLADPDHERAELDDPEQILTKAGFPQCAQTLRATLTKTPKQRDGLIGSAEVILRFLQETTFLPWVESAGPDDTRPALDLDAFVRSADTLYLLSKEGVGSARAITAALTMAACDAAERYATTQRGGRLKVPMLVELDEAANVCRWPELPNLYSHYGSRGILLVTILQSREQGVQAWGASGLKIMTSAANVMGIGRGLRDEEHLAGLVQLIGERHLRALQRSGGGGSFGSGSTSHSVQSEQIFTAADLAAFPRHRTIVFSSGARPVLCALVPWWDGGHAHRIAASNDHYGPGEPDQDHEAVPA